MSQNNVSVLLVDDDYLIQQVYSALLCSANYTVQVADNGVQAIQCLRDHTPDLILSDLDMPEMSGFELLSVVRRRFASIKVVAMSGAFKQSGIPDGLCADAFYPKGKNSPKVLLKTLSDVLREERSEMALKQIAAPPVWTAKILYGSYDEPSIILTCPDCLRPYPHEFAESNVMLPQQSECIFCGCRINYSVATTVFTNFRFRQETLSSLSSSQALPRSVMTLNMCKIPA